MSLFLAKTEVQELTGYERPSYQKKWLAKHGYTFEVGKDASIKLLRAHVEAKLNPGGRRKKTEPNWNAMGA